MDSVLIFSQKSLVVANLARQAATHFAARLDFDIEPDAKGWLGVRLAGPAPYRGSFRIRERAACSDDLGGLDAAEHANQSWGMADLARRCAHVWELAVDPPSSAASAYYLAALLTSVALGPMLPPDGAGLFGVRSCRKRAQALAEQGD